MLLGYRGEEMLIERGYTGDRLLAFNQKVFRDPLWREFDYENIPYEEVVRRYAEKYPEYAEDIHWLFDHAYLMPVHRPKVWHMLHELKKAGYGIYLLSNYSSVLMEMHLHGLPFWKDVDGMVASFQIHEIKPNPGIYQTLMDKYGLDRAECVFFDDHEENVAAGNAFGILSHLVTGEDQLLDLMARYLRMQLLPQAIAYEKVHAADEPAEERPVYHLAPQIGWMNDPNGFSYYRGQYHMFYQYYPYDSIWGPMHWAHAVSEDMLHWKHLPAALAPDQEYDQDGCFSGSALELPDGRQMLIYTSVNRTDKHKRFATELESRGLFAGNADVWHEPAKPCPQLDRQTQSIAIGDGVSYTKYENNPVLDEKDLPDGASIADFRDPKAVRLADGTYRCYCVTNIPEQGGGAVVQYESRDAFHWKYRSTLLQNDGRVGRMWECPDFFEMDGKAVLLASAQNMQENDTFRAGDGNFYMVGSYDDASGKFQPDEVHMIDYGPDFYAEQSVLTPDGRRVIIGWMQNWGTFTMNLRDNPRKWYGQMSTPREISLKNGRLYQQPLRELKALRREMASYSSVTVGPEKQQLPDVEGRCLWLDVDVDLGEAGEGGLKKFTIELAKDAHCHTDIIYNAAEETLILDRSHCGTTKAALHRGYAAVKAPEGKLHLTILIDRFSAEVFVGEGETSLSITFPTALSAKDICFHSTQSAVMDVKAWDLEQI